MKRKLIIIALVLLIPILLWAADASYVVTHGGDNLVTHNGDKIITHGTDPEGETTRRGAGRMGTGMQMH